MCFGLIENDKFSIDFLYEGLESSDPVTFPLRIIWKSCMQPSVSFFA